MRGLGRKGEKSGWVVRWVRVTRGEEREDELMGGYKWEEKGRVSGRRRKGR